MTAAKNQIEWNTDCSGTASLEASVKDGNVKYAVHRENAIGEAIGGGRKEGDAAAQPLRERE